MVPTTPTLRTASLEERMTAAENQKLMQDIFSQLAVGDSSLFVAHLADDIVMRVTGQYSWSRTFNGKQALLHDLYGHVRSLTQDPRKTIPIRFIAGEDHVAVEARGEMTRKDGVPYANEYCLIFKLANGKIVKMREYQDSVLCERVLGQFPAPNKETKRPHR
jgi:ketosteroid isomerase-like protein